MAFWASAAWGREALGVGVETSKRLDLSVRARVCGRTIIRMDTSTRQRGSVLMCGITGHSESGRWATRSPQSLGLDPHRGRALGDCGSGPPQQPLSVPHSGPKTVL